jgi:hypothetical protein
MPCTDRHCIFTWDSATGKWDKLTGCDSPCDCAQDPNDIGIAGAEDGDIYLSPCVL